MSKSNEQVVVRETTYAVVRVETGEHVHWLCCHVDDTLTAGAETAGCACDECGGSACDACIQSCDRCESVLCPVCMDRHDVDQR